MIGMIAGMLLKAGLGPVAARRASIGILIFVGVIAILLLGKCMLDNYVDKHDLEQEAEIVRDDAKADSATADERAIDETRVEAEARELKETVDEARSDGRDPRAAYYECVKQLQSARAAGRPAPACS